MTTTRYDVRRPDPGAVFWAITRTTTDPLGGTIAKQIAKQIAWTLDEGEATHIAYLLAGAELAEGHIATVTAWATEAKATTPRHILYTTEPGAITHTETGDEPSHLVIQRSTRTGTATTIASCPTPELAQLIARALTYQDPYALPTFTQRQIRDALHDEPLTSEQMTDLVGTPGTFARLEGGTLDLGGVTREQAEAFTEEFEGSVRLDGDEVEPGPVERYAEIIVGLLRSGSHLFGYILDRHIGEAMGDDLAAHPDLTETTTPDDTEAGRRRVDLHLSERHSPPLTSVEFDTAYLLAGSDRRTDRVLSYPWLAPGQVTPDNAAARSAQLIACLLVAGMTGPPSQVIVDETTADRVMATNLGTDSLADVSRVSDADRACRRLMLTGHVTVAVDHEPDAGLTEPARALADILDRCPVSSLVTLDHAREMAVWLADQGVRPPEPKVKVIPEWATRYAARVTAHMLSRAEGRTDEHIAEAPSPMADALAVHLGLAEITDEDDHDRGLRRFRLR